MDEPFSLKEQYRQFNRDIFDNRLPEEIKLKWNHSRTAMGKTTVRLSRWGEMTIVLTVSRFFLCSEQQYKETLIHEMIHVLLAVEGSMKKEGLNHGPAFKKEMNRINKDFPQYTITVRETKHIPVDHKKMKNQHGFFLVLENQSYFSLYQCEIDEKMHGKIIRMIQRFFPGSKGSLYFFSGKYQELATAPKRRTIETLTRKLQFLRDREQMKLLEEKISKDYLHRYELEESRTFLQKILKVDSF